MKSDVSLINDVIADVDKVIDNAIDIKYEIEKLRIKNKPVDSDYLKSLNDFTISLNRQINTINKRVNDILFCLNDNSDNITTTSDVKYSEYFMEQLSDYTYKLILPPLLKKTPSLYDAPQLRFKKLIRGITKEAFLDAKIKQFKKADIVFHSIIKDSKYYIDADHLQVHHILNSLVPFFIPDDSPEYASVHYITTVKPSVRDNYTVVYIIGNDDDNNRNFIDFLQSEHLNNS